MPDFKQACEIVAGDTDIDEYPEFTQADIDRATFKVAGKTVGKEQWQQAVRKRLRKLLVKFAKK